MMAEPSGTIAFVTVGIPTYGFDIFSVELPSGGDTDGVVETRHTDGVSVNYNAQFLDDDGTSVAFVSERSGSARLYRSTSASKPPQPLPVAPGSLFHDRPTVRGNLLYFTSAHEQPEQQFKSWSAVFSADIGGTGEISRLTPKDTADLSPAVSPSGKFVAVASYGSKPWKGDFRELQTEIVVFSTADPSQRSVIAEAPAGWPAWAGESTLFFHRTAEDGWWSVYRVDVEPTLDGGVSATGPVKRITPPGVHAFTPAGAADGRRVAVATRRKGRKTRQIEIFDLESEKFFPVTELINPNQHHYNPFFSPTSSKRLGYHRFRGESAATGQVVPHLEPVTVPADVPGIRLLRVYGTFPSFSPDGDLLAVNGDFLETPGLMLMKADGSRRWVLSKDTSFFYTCWSPKEKGVLFTSVGPIFESSKATVQIARVEFDPDALNKENACDQWESLVKVVDMKVKVLTRADTGNNAFPSVSPDGKWIVFRSGRTGQKNLYIVDAVAGETSDSGSGIRRLTEGDWIDTMPAWSPTEDLIAFSSNRHCSDNPMVFSIYLVRSDGTELRRVYVAGPEGSAEADRERINHVCFSPDGNWLLFTANFGGIMVEPMSMPNHFQPYGDLYICRLDGSGLTRLTYNGYENGTPAWHRTGDGLDLGRLKLAQAVGEPLKGQFEEPLWLTCDL